jgi:hypothetical protein
VAAGTAEQAKSLPKLNSARIKNGSTTRRAERIGLLEDGADLCVGDGGPDDRAAGTQAAVARIHGGGHGGGSGANGGCDAHGGEDVHSGGDGGRSELASVVEIRRGVRSRP